MNYLTPSNEGDLGDRLSCIPQGDNILWELRTCLTGQRSTITQASVAA